MVTFTRLSCYPLLFSTVSTFPFFFFLLSFSSTVFLSLLFCWFYFFIFLGSCPLLSSLIYDQYAYVNYADMFLALDKDMNGTLSKQELREYADGTLTDIFIERGKTECLLMYHSMYLFEDLWDVSDVWSSAAVVSFLVISFISAIIARSCPVVATPAVHIETLLSKIDNSVSIHLSDTKLRNLLYNCSPV